MAEKYQVLIVDDIAETRENIRKLLQFESDVEVVGVARTGREAIDLAVELEPDVVLMDINMPDMDGIEATEAIHRKINWVQIVILSVQGDSNYMRRAMLAGARDYLTKPPAIDELISAIRRAGAMAVEEKEKSASLYAASPGGSGPLNMGLPMVANGKIISIYSPKGGTGCSTIAANLAVVLQTDDTQVAIVDGNLQFGDVAILYNEQGKNHIGDLTPRVDELDPEIIEEVMITHSGSGVKILAAPPRPELAEDISGGQFIKLLNFLRRMFPYIIIDTPSTLAEITLSALDVSDILVLVTTQDIPAIANTRLFLDLTTALGVGQENIIFLMNRYDKRINISPEKIGESFKKEIQSVIPLDRRTVIPAMNRGIPFMLDSKNRSQPAARALLSLADIIRKKVSAMEDRSLEPMRSGRKIR